MDECVGVVSVSDVSCNSGKKTLQSHVTLIAYLLPHYLC
jgi:hypothetical protein